MSAAHRSLAIRIAKEIAADSDVRAVLVSGSVARSSAVSESDVDLLLISDLDRPMQRRMIDGLLVEIVAKSVTGWAEAFRRSRPMWLYSMLDAEVIVDDGTAAAAKRDAEEVFATFETPDGVLHDLAVQLWHGRAKVRRAQETGEAEAGYWASVAMPSLLDCLYAVHNRPQPPGSLRLDRVSQVPLTLDERQLVERMLVGSPQDRIDAVVELTSLLMDALPSPNLLLA